MTGLQQMKVITFWLKHCWKMEKHLLQPSTPTAQIPDGYIGKGVKCRQKVPDH